MSSKRETSHVQFYRQDHRDPNVYRNYEDYSGNTLTVHKSIKALHLTQDFTIDAIIDFNFLIAESAKVVASVGYTSSASTSL